VKRKWHLEKEDLAAAEQVSVIEKCTKPLAQIADRNARYHSSLRKEDLYTARTAIRSIRSFNDSKF
jgi:hypothetical protein